MRTIFLIGIASWIVACQQPVPKAEIEAQVRQAEADFNQMAKAEGLPAAFLHFAAEGATLIRGARVVEGKPEIRRYFERPTGLTDVSLTWAPDRIIVSDGGDLAYSFGKYQFSARDTSGQSVTDEGVFRTLWKRQADGTWRYLVD